MIKFVIELSYKFSTVMLNIDDNRPYGTYCCSTAQSAAVYSLYSKTCYWPEILKLKRLSVGFFFDFCYVVPILPNPRLNVGGCENITSLLFTFERELMSYHRPQLCREIPQEMVTIIKFCKKEQYQISGVFIGSK